MIYMKWKKKIIAVLSYSQETKVVIIGNPEKETQAYASRVNFVLIRLG